MRGIPWTVSISSVLLAVAGCASASEDDDPPRLDNSGAFAPGASFEGSPPNDTGEPSDGQGTSPDGSSVGVPNGEEPGGTGFDLTPNTGTGASEDGPEINNNGQPGMGQAGPTGTGFGNGETGQGASNGTAVGDTGTTVTETATGTGAPPTGTVTGGASRDDVTADEASGEAGSGPR